MTTLHLQFDDPTLRSPVERLCKKLRLVLSDNGFPVEIHASDRLWVSADGGSGRIEYVTRASFFRMLTQFVKNFRQGKVFELSETIEISKVGVMFDLSRNGVLSVEGLTDYFEYMAMMGLNQAMLYMEDTYEIPERPYFGYMRGRYSKEELMAIDDAGYQFGIEVFPYIQTLAHMEHYLKTQEAFPARDTARLLCIGAEPTYQLIDQMLAQLKTCFRSKRLHLGLDEAWNMGRGEYLDHRLKESKEVVFPDRGEFFVQHLKRVVEIGLSHGLDLEMWCSTLRRYCTAENFKDFPDIQKVRLHVGTYEGECSEEDLLKMLHPMCEFSKNIALEGGIHTWFGFAPQTYFSLANAHLMANFCKKFGFDELDAYIWMNDGTECNHIFALLAVQAYAEHMYHKEADNAQIFEMFEAITGTPAQAFLDMSAFHNDVPQGFLHEQDGAPYMGKRYVWQDILMGLVDGNLIEHPMSGFYQEYLEKFTAYKERKDDFCLHYTYFEALFDLLVAKCSLAEQLKPRYDAGDKEFLQMAAKVLIPAIREKLEHLRKVHRELWLSNSKPFGQDILDLRYGGIITRCDTAVYRLEQYLSGKLPTLPELDAPRLKHGMLYSYFYSSTSSPSTPANGII